MYDPREDLYGIGPEEDQPDYSNSLSLVSQLAGPLLKPLPSTTTEEDSDLCFPVYELQEKDKDDGSSEHIESTGLEPTPSLIVLPVSQVSIERPEDDLAARILPVRHVDYLSHEWVEGDLWATWKHVVSERGAYDNSVRLENASWRSWEKMRRNLQTVSPGSVKWMKDHDVTWLYGPLQSGSGLGASRRADEAFRRRHHSITSQQSQKPILKKRSLSELMLRKSVSSASLLRQTATAAEFSSRDASFSTYNSFSLTPNPTLTPHASYASEAGTPNPNSWKNVRFYELVEQCVAVATADDDLYGSLDPDDEVVVMKQMSKHTRRQSLTVSTSLESPPSKTIEKLPHAPLKSPEPPACDGLGISYFPIQRVISPPIEPSPALLEEESESEDDEDWNPPKWFRNRKDSVHLLHDKLDAIKRSIGISPSSKPSSDSPLLKTPLVKGHTVSEAGLVADSKKSPITFKLTSFSFTNSTKADMSTPALSTSSSDTKSSWSEAMDPAYTATDYFSPRSADVNAHDDEFDWIEDYPSDDFANKALTHSPLPTQPVGVDSTLLSEKEPVARTSSDSGYGAELTGILRDALGEHASVRDTYNGTPEIEKEKAICDWDLYPGAWDAMELEEAVAWSEGF